MFSSASSHLFRLKHTMPTVETYSAPVLDQTRGSRRRMMDSVAWRLFFTVWLIYTFHFASDVVRDTYLAITLAEDASIRRKSRI